MSQRTSSTARDRRAPFGMMLRYALVSSLVALPVLAAILLAVSGQRAALASLLGGVVVVALFVVGLFGIRSVVNGYAGVSMAGALVVYLGQLIALVVLALVLAGQDWLDGRSFAIGVLAVGLVFQTGQVTGFMRSRMVI